MSKLEKTLIVLDTVELGNANPAVRIGNRALLIVTVIYLALMLGVQVEYIDKLLWFAIYPIVCAPLFGLRFSGIFLQSLIVLPLVLLIAMFNPIIDHTPAIIVGGTVISNGWLSFTGIILRGLLSMQALLILIRSGGFIGMVRSMERLGIPKFLTTQLLMVFRYIKVLVEEVMTMNYAREARGFGRRHLSLKMWGVMIGELFIRSFDRAERVHRSMLARGFDGSIPVYETRNIKWSVGDTVFIISWTVVFIFLRVFNLSQLFVR